MTIYYFESNHRTVTDFYLNIIIEALRNVGFHVVPLPDFGLVHLWRLPKDSWFLTTGHKDILRLRVLGFGHFIHWFQGLPAEEDFMRTHSQWRKRAMNILDRASMRYSRFSFFVSSQQRDYLSSKFGIAARHHFIMPCFNEVLQPQHFFTQGKYDHNTFCYVGSATDPWQCFDQMLAIYRNIERRHNHCHLKILTPDGTVAHKAAQRAQLEHYTIKCVPHEQVTQEIASCKFGFIIREDDVVNHVATPTKMSSYLASGVIPIFSEALLPFNELARQHSFLYTINYRNTADVIDQCLATTFQPQQVLESYRAIFDTYFGRERYLTAITDALRSFLAQQ